MFNVRNKSFYGFIFSKNQKLLIFRILYVSMKFISVSKNQVAVIFMSFILLWKEEGFVWQSKRELESNCEVMTMN